MDEKSEEPVRVVVVEPYRNPLPKRGESDVGDFINTVDTVIGAFLAVWFVLFLLGVVN